VTVQAVIDEQPRFPESPFVVLRWRLPGFGPLSGLVTPVATLFSTPPPWIVLQGDRVIVNVGRLLEERGAGAILPGIAALRLETTNQNVVVSFALRLPPL